MPVFLIVLLAALIVIPVGVVAVLYVIVPIFKGIGWLFRQLGRFVFGELGDGMRIVGALLTQMVFLPLIIVNIVIGRWSAAGHYGRAFHSEMKTMGLCVYRMVIGHPARLLCLTALTDGIEKRLPEVVAAAPTSDKPNPKTTGLFEGYKIVGSLPGGGSGGKLYVAEPDAMKLAIFARAGRPDIRQVVIKTFSLKDGSSLPQIVRESRALEAAKKLGLVLEHELSNDRFYYVTEYVPGESLGLVTQRLHAMSGGDGLDEHHLRAALNIEADLLKTLDGYHRGGLWHKDVKPDNIIVDRSAAHLVDFGLVTPLRSGMTLTTHGTEYFRDPELVRLALKGVKVHQVDGARFDVYAAGAVLFSMIENSFPAHGGLSQISRRCPEAVRWIVRRAMTDYDKRYTSAAAMMADLDVVRRAADPFAVKPIDLPSMRGMGDEMPREAAVAEEAPIRPAVANVGVGAGSDAPGFGPAVGGGFGGFGAAGREDAGVRGAAAGSPAPRRRPQLRVNRWWSGGYVVDKAASPHAAPTDEPRRERPDVFGLDLGKVKIGVVGSFARNPGSPRPAGMLGRSASEQLASARDRARAARERAQSRMRERRRSSPSDFKTMNAGVAMAVLVFFAVIGGLGMLLFAVSKPGSVRVTRIWNDGPTPGMAYAYGDLSDTDGAAVSPVAAAMKDGKPSRAGAAHPRIVINGHEVGSGITMPNVRDVAEGEQVLVISDIQPTTPAINAAIDRLKAAGFVVLGNYPGNNSEEVDLQQQLDLEVAAKAARGLGQLDSDDVSAHLSDWVAEHPDLALLVWFTRTDPNTQAVKFSVVAPRSHSEDSRAVFQAATHVLRP